MTLKKKNIKQTVVAGKIEVKGNVTTSVYRMRRDVTTDVPDLSHKVVVVCVQFTPHITASFDERGRSTRPSLES